MLSTKSSEESPESGGRRERAAIAAQACQTCRSRKSKCDEYRPKCGLCTRLGVDCVYREPQATKKDKTLVHILAVLDRVESKVDRLSAASPTSLTDLASRGPIPDLSRTDPTAHRERSESDIRHQENTDVGKYFPAELVSASSHITAAHRVLMWPSVYLLISHARIPIINDMHHILRDGTPWFTHLEILKHPQPLPSFTSSPPSRSPSTSSSNASPTIAGLTPEAVRRLADAYFDTYNIIHPILDRDVFYLETLDPVIRGVYDDQDAQVCIIMLVLALGQVAIEGVSGQPLSSPADDPSGIRGGSQDTPPGLEVFNEARRRLGFVMQSCTLENVQIYLLQAAYYESCARHMDYWRSCCSASMAFQIYIRCERIDWSAPAADMIKRTYWTCILNEDLYHLELDLPRTGIYALEDHVPLPSFHEARTPISAPTKEASQYHYHFLAMIALRRLIARIHAALHSDDTAKVETSQDYDGPPIHLIKELARQLDSWRSFLPQGLQWADGDYYSYPRSSPFGLRSSERLFTPEDDGSVVTHRHNLDIVTGHLRTRFYYSRYMIYRPFIFKALHFPEAMTEEDASYCALAIQAACMWPLAMAPCKNKKRLVPHLFTWTQNFIGILLILRMVDESECLRNICRDRVAEEDMKITVKLLLDWLRDMKAVDGIADWSWQLLEPLFPRYA